MENPWSDDLFSRKEIAEDLVGYVESRLRFGHFSGQESQVIAVDAEYGIGKTFFLQRLKSQLEQDYLVAYIDAWSDDLVSKPIVALAATLQEAFSSVIEDEKVQRHWTDVAATTGKVAWLAAKGAGLQVAKLAISSGAVQGIGGLIGDDVIDNDAVQDAIKEGLDFGKSDNQAKSADYRNYFQTELEDYRRAKSAIAGLRLSISKASQAAKEAGRRLPVFIIVDELDRCRPDYAISFLENVKHIFSVKEVCFVLGLNSRQLQSSVCHQYGNNFDGRSYLDRFIDRYLILPAPNLSLICKSSLEKISSSDQKMIFARSYIGKSGPLEFFPNHDWLSLLLDHYQISPRSAFKFFDRLQTSIFLLKNRPILMDYLCELIAADMSGKISDVNRPWLYRFQGGFGVGPQEMQGAEFFRLCDNIFRADRESRYRALNQETAAHSFLLQFAGEKRDPGAEVYSEMVKRVARFLPVDDQGPTPTLDPQPKPA